MSATITQRLPFKCMDNFVDSVTNDNIYLVAGRIHDWLEEDSESIEIPENAYANELTEAKFRRSMIFAKKIDTDNLEYAVRRFDWETGTIYTQYTDQVDITYFRNWLSHTQPFYVMTNGGSGSNPWRVYKCISNNNGAISTVDPYEIGDSFFLPKELADGYWWKFMFDISTAVASDFLTDDWMPVPTLQTKTAAQLNAENWATSHTGEVERVDVINGGADYPITLQAEINGDGYFTDVSSVLTVNVNGGTGEITSVDVSDSDSGLNFTQAVVDLIGVGSGTGAELEVILTPNNGHGSNAAEELGARFMMIQQGFLLDEGGDFSTSSVLYRSVGLWKNPSDNEGIDISTATKFNLSTWIEMSGGTTTFIEGDKVAVNPEPTDGREDKYSEIHGYVYISSVSTEMYINNIIGELEIGDIFDNETDNAITDITYPTNPDKTSPDGSSRDGDDVIDLFSGEIIYIENVIPIARLSNQSEYIKFVIEF